MYMDQNAFLSFPKKIILILMQHTQVSKLYNLFFKLKTKTIIKSFASYLIVLDSALYQTSDRRSRPSRALADTSSAGVYFE